MKPFYLFAVLVGVKTILAEVADVNSIQAPPSYSRDNSYDRPSYSKDDSYDKGYDDYDNDDSYDNYDDHKYKPSKDGYGKRGSSEYNDYDKDNYGYKPSKSNKYDSYDDDDYKSSKGNKYGSYDDDDYKSSKGNKYGSYDDDYKPSKKSYDDDNYGKDSYGDNDYGYKPSRGGKYSSYNDNNYGYQPSKGQYGGYDDDYDKPSYGKYKGGEYYGKKNGYDKYGRPDYGNPTYAPPVYEPYTAHYKKYDEAPFPYTVFADDKKKENILSVPKLGDYHCFLTGAPWTSCGRKSLTTYFLDQCLVLYFSLSANVDGICGGEPPKPTPEPQYYNDNYYSQDYKKRPTPEPTTKKPTTTKKDDGYGYGATTVAPSPTPSSYEITPDYLKEKCLQSAYVSITAATVMCLTENYIRINFIEHYAAKACNNPVEGPILYLKKIHAFIHSVLECNPGGQHQFPNLYKSFKPDNKVTYNPNAPYYLDSDNRIVLQQYTSGEASGLAAFTVGKSYECANPNDLIKNTDKTKVDAKFIYTSIPSTNHYIYKSDEAKTDLYDQCENSAAKTALGDKVYRFCKTEQYTTDRTYRGLYDAVHYIERESSALRRPQSIAEVAIRHAGVIEQPILEGFGIMYFCAFHACRANNNGDLSKCYPEFDEGSDWTYLGMKSLKELSNTVNTCIDEGYLDSEDITSDKDVAAFNAILSSRSYLCLAENEIVDFLDYVYKGWAATTEDDAFTLVYGRHLADEKCYASVKRTVNAKEVTGCKNYNDVYDDLKSALESLEKTCKTNKTPKRKPHYGGYGKPQYGDNYGGYERDSYDSYGKDKYERPHYGGSSYDKYRA